MPHTIAPAARALLAEATRRAPNRDRSKDGLIGDTAHSTRPSWHNPNVRRQTAKPSHDPDGVVLAVDLTHDPANGCDAHQLARDVVVRRDPRVYEAISNGRIWTKLRASEGWRPYSGSNPHREHAHLSLTYSHHEDTSPWWPAPAAKDDLDMTTDELKALLDAQTQQITGGRRVRDANGQVIDTDPAHVSNADIVTALERMTDRLIAAIKETSK